MYNPVNTPVSANTPTEKLSAPSRGIQAVVDAVPDIPGFTEILSAPFSKRSCQPHEPTRSSLPPHSVNPSSLKSIAGWAGCFPPSRVHDSILLLHWLVLLPS